MSRNGSGVYTPPGASFPYVADTLIEAAKVNAVINDLADALTASVAADGQTAITGNQPMSGNRHTGVGNGSARTDYAAMGQVQDSAPLWAGTAGGTANALTLTLTPAITAYAAGQRFSFKSSASANTTAAAVAVNGLAAKAIQANGAALAGGEIAANQWYEILYDGAAFQLATLTAVQPVANGGTGATAAAAARTNLDAEQKHTGTVTAAVGDLVLIADISDSNNPKYATALSVAQLQTVAAFVTITADPGPAVAFTRYMCNTTAGAFTVTLPAAPSAGDRVGIADYAGTFGTNALTVGRNALKIMGLAEDMVISRSNVSITLEYVDATQGWRVT